MRVIEIPPDEEFYEWTVELVNAIVALRDANYEWGADEDGLPEATALAWDRVNELLKRVDR